jgi:hypothetical protein
MKRNKPPLDAPLVQWANGRVEARHAAANQRFLPLVGWHIESGKYPEIDAFGHASGWTQLDIRHQRPGGTAEIVAHWFLGEVVWFYPLTEGPVTTTVAAACSPFHRAATIAAGIGVCWTGGSDGRSRLALRGYLAVPRAEAGVDLLPDLVQITVRSHMSDALLRALIDHVRVCEFADTLIDRARHPEPVLLWEVALPLGPGPEAVWGKTATTTVIPIVSQHPPGEVDLAHLRRMWRPHEVAARAARDWTQVPVWAAQFAANGGESPSSAEPGDD